MDKALANGALDAPIEATQAPTVLPAWQLSYDLKVDEAQKRVQEVLADSSSPLQVALAAPAEEGKTLAVSFKYGFNVQDR